MKLEKKIPVIIPTITKDYARMRKLLIERIFMYLPVSELIFIGNRQLCDMVNEDISRYYTELPIKAFDEEKLLPRQPIVDYITARVKVIDEELIPKVRCGWYYQQFLKMSFCEVCNEDYYMSWDMDTVPLRCIDVFDDGAPVFGTKSEYNPGYFITIENLLGIKKNVESSFISEHMVFKTYYMKELIDSIGGSPVKGASYYEKIIEAIDDDYISLGFSEFETYGTYITDKHDGSYRYREFSSFRRGSWFVKEDEIDDDDIRWLAEDYDAVTFENADIIPDMAGLFKNPKYRNSMSARKFYETILESGYFGEYSDGRINAGDWYAPV